ncbi:MAG: SdpI family protein [Terrimicrobiaceae bacterium]
MNRFYGVRFPEAYHSDENWFDLNEYGGRLLLGASIVIYLVAFAGFAIPTDYEFRLVYSLAAPGVIIAMLIFMTVKLLFYARFYGKNKKGQST